jgi:hypothetical protein
MASAGRDHHNSLQSLFNQRVRDITKTSDCEICKLGQAFHGISERCTFLNVAPTNPLLSMMSDGNWSRMSISAGKKMKKTQLIIVNVPIPCKVISNSILPLSLRGCENTGSGFNMYNVA